MVNGLIECHSEIGIKLQQLIQEVNSLLRNAWEFVLKVHPLQVVERGNVVLCLLVCHKAHIFFAWRSQQGEDLADLITAGHWESINHLLWWLLAWGEWEARLALEEGLAVEEGRGD